MKSRQSHWLQLQVYVTVAALFVSSMKLDGVLAVPVKMMTYYSPIGLVLLVFYLPASLVCQASALQ